MTTETYGITEEEKKIAGHCLGYALKCGASQARISLNKSTLDSFQLLNGELDKVSRCADRSVFIYLYVDGKYGTYSTNRLDTGDLESFIRKAIDSTRMLAPDSLRRLADPERTEKGAATGKEMGLYDTEYENMTARKRLELAMGGTIFRTAEKDARYSLISEECEYSDSIDDNYVIDSNGFEGRHTETSFSFWTEVTIEDTKGHKYSGYWWTSSPRFSEIKIMECGPSALSKAAGQIGPKGCKGGKMTMVVDNLTSSRLVSPIFSALNGSSIQQHNSFLEDTLGKKVFPEELTVMDMARTEGMSGARMFDTEGVATMDRPVIGNGVIEMYFISTYLAGKMGMEPTVEGISRPVVAPFVKGQEACTEIGQKEILMSCGDGILVTGFNGGNCNPTTGNFSYGVEGFVFRDGKILHPVKEMVITGNMLTLWNSVVAAGSDARHGARWQIPTLAFADVDFSA
ncbi:MAG: TldD/PmbA family protein [Bacteroidales bacterium]|nr:TldD/PmbA family protein [Bacteroidales bacterium]